MYCTTEETIELHRRVNLLPERFRHVFWNMYNDTVAERGHSGAIDKGTAAVLAAELYEKLGIVSGR
jgi:hypothetical protein